VFDLDQLEPEDAGDEKGLAREARPFHGIVK